MTTALKPTGIVPPPPTIFDTAVTELPVGFQLWRIHDERFAGDEFNPGLGASRFAPIGPKRKRIPTAYAASDFEAAVFETILHDIDPVVPFKFVRRSALTAARCSVLRVAVPLRLRSFLAPDLMKLRVERTRLIDTLAREYPDTRRWSEALHRRDHDTHGMVWSSRPYPSAEAMMLFGDRTPPGALSVVVTTAISEDPVLTAKFRTLMARSGVELIK